MPVEHKVISKEKESYNFFIVHRLGCCLEKCWGYLASSEAKLLVRICQRPLEVTI